GPGARRSHPGRRGPGEPVQLLQDRRLAADHPCMDTTTLGRRGLLAVLVAVTAVLAAATPARAATEADAGPAGAVTGPVPPEEGHGAQLHLARADTAPPSDRTEARAGYSKPGWLPFRNRHTLGCVTTN